MNLDETLELIDLIRGYTPSFVVAQQTPAVWAHALADIPAEVATAAVHAHYADSTTWITVAHIRRRAAATAGVLPPDAATAQAQAIALNGWYGPIGSQPDPNTRPAVHPAVQATIKAVGGVDVAAHLNRFDWRDAYRSQVELFERRALAPGGVPAVHREITAPPPRPRPALDAPPAPETFEKAVELRSRREGDIARLDAAIASLGADARFLLPRTTRLESRFGQAALRHKMRDFGADHDLDEAMRRARLEIARHSDSNEAADFEARRAAALRALEAMGNDGTEATA